METPQKSREPSDWIEREVVSVLENIRNLPLRPIVLEAYWDGDFVNGWFVDLVAIVDEPSYDDPRFSSRVLASYTLSRVLELLPREGGLYPHGRVAAVVGRAVARKLGIPFHFASPQVADDDVPRWWDSQPSSGGAWRVAWRVAQFASGCLLREKRGESVEEASCPREAHDRVIDRLTSRSNLKEIEQLGLEHIELTITLCGLSEGDIVRHMWISPTSYKTCVEVVPSLDDQTDVDVKPQGSPDGTPVFDPQTGRFLGYRYEPDAPGEQRDSAIEDLIEALCPDCHVRDVSPDDPDRGPNRVVDLCERHNPDP